MQISGKPLRGNFMHIPDGFLSTPVWGTSAGISIGYIIFALRRLRKILQEKLIPVMGVLSAFIFAAQMINFPVAGATSGHLMGGLLATIIVGPYAGSFILATVLIVQCLIFQDGGLLALGANILNIAIIGTLGGYGIYIFLKKFLIGKSRSKFRTYLSYGVAAWFSVILASIACAVELALSKTVPLKIVLPTMVGMHMLIGVGEAIITVFTLAGIHRIRPDLIVNRVS